MEESLIIIDQFLRQFAPEVAGRSTEALVPDLQEKIRRFSKGELPEKERREFSRELLSNQKAFEYLVDQLKRGDGAADSS